jgi:hypothetical protein
MTYAQRQGAALALTAMAAVGCGKSAPPAAGAPGAAVAAVGLPAAASATAAAPVHDKVRLAQWFAPLRCQALGMAVANPRVYAEAGFDSAAGFAAAFDAAAAADPAWARQVVAQAYATPCPQGKGQAAPTPAAPPPEAPTPASGENP